MIKQMIDRCGAPILIQINEWVLQWLQTTNMLEVTEELGAAGICPRAAMVFVPGSTFRRGSDKHYPEEAPGWMRPR